MSKPLTPAQLDIVATRLVQHPAFLAQLQALLARLASQPPTPCWPTPGLVTTTVYDCDGRLVRVEGSTLPQTVYAYEPASNDGPAPAKPRRPAKAKRRPSSTAAHGTTDRNGQARKTPGRFPWKSTARRVARGDAR
jgi:hypothetical protein